jgi:predicted Zn-dependent peptidase
MVSRICVHISKSSVDESDSEIGLAHLLEHMLMDSSKKYSIKYLGSIGIRFNAKTTATEVIYTIYGHNKYMDIMLSYMKSIIYDPLFKESVFVKAKQSAISELLGFFNKSSIDIYNQIFNYIGSSNDSIGLVKLNDWSFKINKYSKYTMQDIINYYKKVYVPKNILFVVVSNSKVIYSKSFVPNNIKFKEPKSITTQIVTQNQIKNANIVIIYISDINNHIDYLLYLDIIQDLLTGSMTSELYVCLRDLHKLIYHIGLSYIRIHNLLLSCFEFSCPFDSVDETILRFFECIDELNSLTTSYKTKQINSAKERVLLDFEENSLSNKTEFLEHFYATQIVNGHKKIEDHNVVLKKVQDVSDDYLMKVMKHLFNKKSVIVYKQIKDNASTI